MAYDPTTENETPWEDHGIDHDDDDDDEEYTTPRSSPMKPPPAPPPPEDIEMRQLPREQNGWRRQQAAWVALKKMYPQANKDALEVSYVKMPGEITPRLSEPFTIFYISNLNFFFCDYAFCESERHRSERCHASSCLG